MTLEVSDVASINFFKKTDGVELANLSRAERISISYRAEETTERQKNFPLALHCNACKPVGYYNNLDRL